MDFNTQMESYVKLINDKLDKILEIPDNYQKIVYEAMKYGVDAGGKRIRPVLALAVCDMLDGDINKALPFASAIELIHTYSLIHDDLPCMDDDDIRRGKPSCHKAFGESTALLAGDGLLTLAFEVMAENESVESEITLHIIKLIAHNAGCGGMIGGQVVDMLCESAEGGNDDIDSRIEKVEYIHENKTGKLIEASAMIGAKIGRANEEDVKKLKKFAQKLGLAFQIKDDILDVTGEIKKLGKKVGSDAKQGKATFVTLYGLDNACEALKRLTDEAVSELSAYGDKADFLKKLSMYLLKRDN